MICAIILAAGRSRRMGAQKVLLPFAGRTVIGHIAGEILRSAVAEVIVVAGTDVPRLAEALAGCRVTLATNPDADGDMLSSVRCGLRALPPGCEAVLVALGDQPSITADLVGRMLDAFRTSGRGIVVPACGGRPGHPILFSIRYREEVLTRYDGVGLCGLRQAHPEDVFELGVTDSSVLADMDRPEDYRRALAEFRPGPPVDKTGF
jgi:molybdenum cofactor cytidylyltransferase